MVRGLLARLARVAGSASPGACRRGDVDGAPVHRPLPQDAAGTEESKAMGTAHPDEDTEPQSPAPAAGAEPASVTSAGGRFCPNCDAPLADGAVLCTECGCDLRTGTVLADGAKPLPPAPPPASVLRQTVLDFFPGLYYPGIMVLALLCTAVAAVLAVLTMFVFGLGAYLSAGAIGVATLAVWTQTVTLMCVGRAEFFNTAMGDIEGTQFQVFIGLILAPPVAVWVLLGWLSSGKGG
jgi:hypothetical protein